MIMVPKPTFGCVAAAAVMLRTEPNPIGWLPGKLTMTTGGLRIIILTFYTGSFARGKKFIILTGCVICP